MYSSKVTFSLSVDHHRTVLLMILELPVLLILPEIRDFVGFSDFCLESIKNSRNAKGSGFLAFKSTITAGSRASSFEASGACRTFELERIPLEVLKHLATPTSYRTPRNFRKFSDSENDSNIHNHTNFRTP